MQSNQGNANLMACNCIYMQNINRWEVLMILHEFNCNKIFGVALCIFSTKELCVFIRFFQKTKYFEHYAYELATICLFKEMNLMMIQRIHVICTKKNKWNRMISILSK